jgi:hypothetical protein
MLRSSRNLWHTPRDISIQILHVQSPIRRWPKAQIPFEIDPTLSVAQRQILLDAMSFWNNLAGVQLTPHTNEPDFVMYTDATGQFGELSVIVQNDGMQTIRMDYGWSEAGGALVHS